MKNLSSLFLSVFMLLVLVGCSNETAAKPVSSNQPAEQAGKQVEQAGKEEKKSFVFEYKGQTIEMNAKAEPILKALGDPMEYFESESCAFEGKDKVYTYSGFELHTYTLNGADFIASVRFLDDSVTTKEGITISAKVEDVLKTYGDKYSESQGVYNYELNDSKISFLTKEGEVKAVEYNAIVKTK